MTFNEARIKRLEDSNKAPPGAADFNLENIIAEMIDRAQRAPNVMVYNFPISSNPDLIVRMFMK